MNKELIFKGLSRLFVAILFAFTGPVIYTSAVRNEDHPFFIPVLALVVSFMLVKHNRSIFFNKISIFGYSFIILIYAELVIRYTGISKTMGNLFLLSPIVLYLLTYFILRLKLSKE